MSEHRLVVRAEAELGQSELDQVQRALGIRQSRLVGHRPQSGKLSRHAGIERAAACATQVCVADRARLHHGQKRPEAGYGLLDLAAKRVRGWQRVHVAQGALQ